MDPKPLRTLIYIFSGIIVVFSLLMLVNYLGSLSGSSYGGPGQADLGGGDDASGSGLTYITTPKYGPGSRNSLLPAGGTNFSTYTVASGGVSLLVKEKNFSGVAETPKGMMDLLNDMGGGGRDKKPLIALKESDLDKKISVPVSPVKRPANGAAPMPELGRNPGQEGVTLLGAPVDYKLFKSSETWWAFANSHKLRAAAPDFSSSDLLILVSVSDFPSGIFKIAGVAAGKKETLVTFRVDPLAMSPETPREQREAYASAAVPKKIPVKLQQVP